ncbi:MAG: recombinase RecX [Desulfuromonas sp.]|nr:MAG: recombinase RecX [Desulfuromonas sp.]
MRNSRSTESDPRAAALRLLTGRDRSEAEVQKKLLQFGFSAEQAEDARNYCREYGYLDDQRYALDRARMLIRSGCGVGAKVLLDLRRRGIEESMAQAALAQAGEEFDTLALLQEQLERRFPGFDYRRANDKLKRRVVSYFQRRGYLLDQIFSVLHGNGESS